MPAQQQPPGADHYAEAKRLIAGVTTGSTYPDGSPITRGDEPDTIALAQTHALLALVDALAGQAAHQ